MLALLTGKNLGKIYESGLIFKKQNLLFQDISLVIEEGRTLGLMGPSGIGKTTLGMIMAGMESPTSGYVCYQGKDIEDLKGKDLISFKRQVQMVFQDPQGSLNPRKSIERSIHEVLGLLGIPRREWQERTKVALEKVGLSEEMLCRYPGQISGGQCQRVALSRVLLLRPKVIILDEPTSALDISVQAQILNMLKDLQKDMDMGYLLISHQPEVIRFMAHETMVLEDGIIHSR
jgi:peptide/nickel transport system ATP-binding protein